MKHRIIPVILLLTLALGLLPGCQIAVTDPTGENGSGEPSAEYSYTPDTTILFSKAHADITGPGATVDSGEVLIVDGGVYALSGAISECRVKIEADADADVVLLLSGVSLDCASSEAIYAKTAGSLTVVAMNGTENTLTSGLASELDTNAEQNNSGAALRAKCPMTLTGTGSLTVNGYINNGVAAEGDLTMDGLSLSVTCANDGVKSDAAITVLSGTYAVTSRHDAFQAGTDLTFNDGAVTVFTGVGSADADMKVGDSSMMGNMGGGFGGGGGGIERTDDLSGIDFAALGIDLSDVDITALNLADDAIEKLGLTGTDLTHADLSGLDLTNINLDDYGLRRRDITSLLNVSSDDIALNQNADNNNRGGASDSETARSAASDEAQTESTDTATDNSQSEQGSASREQRMPGMMPGMGGASGEASGEAEETVSDSAKGLKATNSITVSGGCFLLDCEDDAVHSDGTVTVSGGELTVTTGDDGIHGDDRLTITGGIVDIQKSFEGLEANIILIDDGIVSIVASDDGMNASGGGFGMMFGGSREASGETTSEETDTTASGEVTETASDELTETASEEADSDDDLVGPLLRIRGGVVTVDSGGDGLDSNGNFYLMGGTVYVSGPSTDWDAPVDTGDGSYEFLITGGRLMAAGYSGMAETPGRGDDSQCSIYYTVNTAVPDGALCTLSDTAGNILLQYTFVHSYNCVILSCPSLTVGETYILTVDGTDYEIELTDSVFSTRGSSGEMFGFGRR